MKKGGSSVVVVVLLVVIAIAAAFIIKAAIPKRYPRPNVDWTCEACDYKFVAEAQAKPMVCPECGGEAVRTYYYYCSVHDHVFEAYRSKPNPDVTPEEMGPPEEMMLYKLSGGKWTTEFPAKIRCPKGNSDPETISYCPPGSEKRE